MATTSNLGRVQGGGYYSSSSTSTTSILKSTLVSTGIAPLVGDIIVNANGDLCLITAITDTSYTVTKKGSIKGADGKDGVDGKDGKDADVRELVNLGGEQVISGVKHFGVDATHNVVIGYLLTPQGFTPTATRPYMLITRGSDKLIVYLPMPEGKAESATLATTADIDSAIENAITTVLNTPV